MLNLESIHTYYGESHILQGIHLHVEGGECVALLGPNGMGKTTTLRTIMGLTPPRAGRVRFKGQDITRHTPFQIARLGIGYVPEDRGLFVELTVVENLKVPFLNLKQRGQQKWGEIENRIYSLFPVLNERKRQMAGTLSGGEQQMLATARALISGEEMVLLDEPTEGLAPVVVQNLIGAFQKIKEQKHTMLLVEQNIHTAMEVADRCYILEKGRIKLEEPMKALSQRPDLLQQYLGVDMGESEGPEE
jgi:branched-chain amino acid transport system ATP-binding protein